MPLTVRSKNTIDTRHGANRKKMQKDLKGEENLTNKKRMASSPPKGEVIKRSAFGDLTNAIIIPSNEDKTRKQLKKRKTIKAAELSLPENKTLVSKNKSIRVTRQSRSLSQINPYRSKPPDDRSNVNVGLTRCFYEHEASPERKALKYKDIDKENISNPNETPTYGFVIFEYMRARERQFSLTKYMATQHEITPDMRAILIDWMVEVQENFELNHETLYLAVKLTDHYLSRTQSQRESLQLIGAAALLIAAKFDERHPPYVDDFLYICDDAYNRNEILAMERTVLQIVGFDINIPISYRYLRRYAKCSKTNMETLTLARFALELSLQYYDFICESDSLMAAGALWLAFQMKSTGSWTDTLVFYSSHNELTVAKMAVRLNQMIQQSKGKRLQTVWMKYSHTIFYEVAKTPTLTETQLNHKLQRITEACEKQETQN